MEFSLSCCVLLSVFLIFSLTNGKEYDPSCIIDSSLEASATDNYLDCTSDDMVAEGRTKCCKVEGEAGCCDPGGRWKKILAIGLGIGLTFLILAVIYIYLFWCKKDTIPCLGRLQDRVQKKYYQVEEVVPCCASRVERRKQEEEIMKKSKDQPAYSLPDDEACIRNYKEEWWNGQTIKNF